MLVQMGMLYLKSNMQHLSLVRNVELIGLRHMGILNGSENLETFPIGSIVVSHVSSSYMSELMTWHNKNRSVNRKVFHAPDNKAWQHIDSTWLDFAIEPKNVKLGLATDGVNPFGETNNSHSTWPILILNYNVPPWVVTKNFFLLLPFIISKFDNVKFNHFDIFLTHVLDEL
jgi:hypothetical protein